jgi:ABC-type sugar transport system substrate-binding protein
LKQNTVVSFILIVCIALLTAACGATPAVLAPTEPAAPAAEKSFALPSAQGFVVGYEAGEKQNVDGLLKACAETKMECVRGKDIDDLVKKGVDAIISYSNQWHVFGVWPQIQNAKKAAIPIFMLNADSGEQGVYNLSTLYISTLGRAASSRRSLMRCWQITQRSKPPPCRLSLAARLLPRKASWRW